jgi:hypothetical protein
MELAVLAVRQTMPQSVIKASVLSQARPIQTEVSRLLALLIVKAGFTGLDQSMQVM